MALSTTTRPDGVEALETGGEDGWGMASVANSTFSRNSASNGGGGIDSYSGGALSVTASTFESNSAAGRGGGIYNEASGSVLVVIGSTFSANVAESGGGIANDSDNVLTLTNSTLSGNSAGDGGGIQNVVGATLTVTYSTLNGNSATNVAGGGIWNEGTVQLTHSTLSNNSANVHGGGIANGGTVNLASSTVTENTADDGGGISNFLVLTLVNSIIAFNFGERDCYPGAAITSLGYNIDGDDSCNLTEPTDQPDTDPLLGPLQDNGGPTWTHALPMASPAVDQGSCPGVTADQRGLPRPVDLPGIANADDGCDVGAYELQEPTIYLPMVFLP